MTWTPTIDPLAERRKRKTTCHARIDISVHLTIRDLRNVGNQAVRLSQRNSRCQNPTVNRHCLASLRFKWLLAFASLCRKQMAMFGRNVLFSFAQVFFLRCHTNQSVIQWLTMPMESWIRKRRTNACVRAKINGHTPFYEWGGNKPTECWSLRGRQLRGNIRMMLFYLSVNCVMQKQHGHGRIQAVWDVFVGSWLIHGVYLKSEEN